MESKLKRILIVDDDPANLSIMELILAEHYSLVFARNGWDALASVVKHQPAMVLLDIGLPDIDGYELCRQIRRLDPTHSVQVIFVTGYSDAAHEAAGFEAGGVDYIVKPVLPQIVRARVSAHLARVQVSALEQSYRAAILMLGQAGHYNDTDTGAHIWRMAAYARAIAQAYGWDAESSDRLELAAPMHDTGKLGIPQAILRKPGPLDAQEWTIMRTHPQVGFEILSKSSAPIFKLAAEVSLCHHEKWDGTGYPLGLKGPEIPLMARIFSIVDNFDALTSIRPYRKRITNEEAIEYLKEKVNEHFDADIVHLFEKMYFEGAFNDVLQP